MVSYCTEEKFTNSESGAFFRQGSVCKIKPYFKENKLN